MAIPQGCHTKVLLSGSVLVSCAVGTESVAMSVLNFDAVPAKSPLWTCRGLAAIRRGGRCSLPSPPLVSRVFIGLVLATLSGRLGRSSFMLAGNWTVSENDSCFLPLCPLD